MKYFLITLALLLAGCGTRESSVPLYPSDWPALVKGSGESCPDISGTYRAVSEPVGPLLYPKGGAPREDLFFIKIGEVPTPKLGRRVLPWHLAVRPSEDVRDSLASFDLLLRPDDAHPDGKVDLGWVRITRADAGQFRIECGVDEQVMFAFMLKPAPAQSPVEWLVSSPRGYVVDDGALATYCSITASKMEHVYLNKYGKALDYYEDAGGYFTFRCAADGSLVMVENLFYQRTRSNSLSFQKWWRWRRIG